MPLEQPDTVPEVGGDWEATPWLACTTCGYAESEGAISVGIAELDDVPPEDPLNVQTQPQLQRAAKTNFGV